MNTRQPELNGAWRRALHAVAGLLLLAGVAALGTRPARAEDRFMLQGLFDAEGWKTDSGSTLLSRDGGGTAAGGRLRIWAAGDFAPGLQGYLLGTVYGGPAIAEEEGEIDKEVEQAFLRYTFSGPARLVLQAGKITTPVGDFSSRYFSSQNPLIGVPDTYDVSYPYGFKAAGWAGKFDYTVAAIDHPMSNEKYTPAPSDAWRPVIGAGYTPIVGLRFAAFYTQGAYLGDEVASAIPAGATWHDYNEAIQGFDAQYSRGYLEIRSEYTRSSYEVPTLEQSARGYAWYVEPKYTFTPRLFAALRIEQNKYPYIASLPFGWIAPVVSFMDAEAGIGWRVATGTIVKASYRRDRWNVDESLKDILPDGYAFALQLSYTFDVVNWVERPH